MAKAWPVPGLGRRTRFREAAGRVILVRWHEMMSYRAGTELGADIEELHAMRVSSRRLRAAMDAFEGAFPRKRFRAYLRQVKAITDTLGAARDLDVAVERLEKLHDRMAADEQPGVRGLIERYAGERRLEDAKIAALFAHLDEIGFGPDFETFIGEHTGVTPADVGLAAAAPSPAPAPGPA